MRGEDMFARVHTHRKCKTLCTSVCTHVVSGVHLYPALVRHVCLCVHIAGMPCTRVYTRVASTLRLCGGDLWQNPPGERGPSRSPWARPLGSSSGCLSWVRRVRRRSLVGLKSSGTQACGPCGCRAGVRKVTSGCYLPNGWAGGIGGP